MKPRGPPKPISQLLDDIGDENDETFKPDDTTRNLFPDIKPQGTVEKSSTSSLKGSITPTEKSHSAREIKIIRD